MNKNYIIKHAFINALLTALYVMVIGTFLYLGSLGLFGKGNTVLVPIAMLMLFVFSAAITGSLIFGKPAILYLDGKKNESLSLLFYTLGVLLLITVVVLLLLFYFI